MSQVQWRSDDTSQWIFGFGSGGDGAGSINTSTDSPTVTSYTGTSGQNTGTVSSASGFSIGNIVIIHQTQGTNFGTWQLNYITNISGTTFTFFYNNVVTYGTGCQIQRIPQYTTLSINSGQTVTGSQWGGTTGGIYTAFANQSISVPGNISVNGKGYRGGASINASAGGQQGESGTAAGGTVSSSANGAGGGGGGNSSNIDSAGSGGSASSGTSGQGNGTGGSGGGTSGAAGLTTMDFGGAGGSGSSHGNGSFNSGAGGNSAGLILLVAPVITFTGGATLTGNQGGNASFPGGSDPTAGAGGGSGGSGGTMLLKGQTITLGSTLITALGGAGGTGGSETNSGLAPGTTGSVGRIHADYSGSISGTTNPTIDERKDGTIVPSGGGSFIYNIL